MSDEYKIIEVKNYLQLHFQGFEIISKEQPQQVFGKYLFEIIRDYEPISTIVFRRNVWDDRKSVASHLSAIQLAERIKENNWKKVIVTEKEAEKAD